MRRLVLFLTCMVAMAVASHTAAVAQTLFEKLVMPGPLTKSHAKFEETCSKCHTPFQGQMQSSLCLDCHDKIAADRKAKEGFHTKNPAASSSDCRHCHTDHKGRQHDIIGLDMSTFDHRQTDFQLDGKHVAAPCQGCHKPNVPYRAAPSKCVECHRSADPHKGNLGDDCQSCHVTKAWTETKPFDHAKTKFALVDAHQKVACDKCHSGEIYKGAPTKCSGCHAVQDVHAGELGARCETCHQPKTWKAVKFDHARDTKFPLRGAHKKAKCDTCHAGNAYDVKLPMTCNGCHGRQDPHKGELGTQCARCHNEDGWLKRVAFDHDLTRFPLIGLHAAVGCDSCHRSKSFKEAPRDCTACHSDTAHGNRLGPDCARCHTPNGWRRWAFDHAREANFPLDGAHGAITCHACHQKPAARSVTTSRTCYGCHSGDDVHQGAFGQECATCHTSESFSKPRLRR